MPHKELFLGDSRLCPVDSYTSMSVFSAISPKTLRTSVSKVYELHSNAIQISFLKVNLKVHAHMEVSLSHQVLISITTRVPVNKAAVSLKH